MERWQHLQVRVNRVQHNEQILLVPHQHDVETELQDVSPLNVVAVLDELGSHSWQLVAVLDDEFWMKRPAVDTSGEVHVY